MRTVFVVAALGIVTRPALAAHLWDDSSTPVYPDALVDRPLLLLPGMTAIDAGYALHSHDQLRFLDYTPDLAVAHSFGPVQIDARIGGDAALQIAFPLGRVPDAIVFGATTTPQSADKTMFISQYVEAEHKLHVIPQSLAFVVGLGGAYDEEHVHAPGLQWVRVVDVAVYAQIEIQLASIVALYADASIGYPVAASNHLDFQALFDARAGLSLTVAHSWDVFAAGAVDDDNAEALYSLGAGVEKRFGP